MHKPSTKPAKTQADYDGSLAPVIVRAAGLIRNRDRADINWLRTHGNGKYSLLISSTPVKRRIAELAQKIAFQLRENNQKKIHFLVVMNGAVFFARRLAEEMAAAGGPEIIWHYLKASSYGNAEHSSGRCRFSGNLRKLSGKDVIIIEDICDSGLTLETLQKRLLKKERPVSVRTCVLLDKPSRRLTRLKAKLAVDFIGFQIPSVFVAGCGLHYGRYYRDLPFVICRKKDQA